MMTEKAATSLRTGKVNQPAYHRIAGARFKDGFAADIGDAKDVCIIYNNRSA